MDELTALYRRLARQAHPDTGPAAERGIRHILMQQINVAYAAKDVALLQRLATEVDAFSPDHAPPQPRETRTPARPQPETKGQPSTGDQRSQSHRDERNTAFRTEAEQRRLEQEARAATEAHDRAWKAFLRGDSTFNGKDVGSAELELRQAYIIASWRAAKTPDEIWKWQWKAFDEGVQLPLKPMSEQEMNRRINLSNDDLLPYAQETLAAESKFYWYLKKFIRVSLDQYYATNVKNRNVMSNRYRDYLRLKLRGEL